MAVRIRMKRMGRTHRPFYRICVMDARKPRDGKAIEEIGTYDPMVRDKSQRVTLKDERLDYWLGVGAKPTEKVQILIDKVKENRWGAIKEPPAALPPKQPEPEAPAEEAAAEGDSAETAESTEETAATEG